MRELMKALGVHKQVQRKRLELLKNSAFSARELVGACSR